MPRPPKKRRIEGLPAASLYIPAGWTHTREKPSDLAVDDFEVMRLVDGHGLQIGEAAVCMEVSRSTAGRMLKRARRILALAIERQAPLYIDASPDFRLSTPVFDAGDQSDEPFGGGVAVALSENKQRAMVADIFGRAPFLAIAPPGAEVEIVKNPGASRSRDAAKVAANLLARKRIRRAVAGRFGHQALAILSETGIEPMIAIGLRLDEALSLYRDQRTDPPPVARPSATITEPHKP